MSVRVSIKKASTGLRNKMANGGGLKLQLVGGVEKNERNGKKKKNSQKEEQNQIHKQTVY